MDPAEILTDSDRTKDETSAPQAAHWLAHPAEKPARRLTQAELLALESPWIDPTERTL